MNSLMSGAGQAVQAERPQTQVEEQMTRLQTLSGDLEKMTAVLQERLAGVSRASERNDKEPPASPRPLLVPLAETLNGIGDQLNRSINFLRDLNAGIELPF